MKHFTLIYLALIATAAVAQDAETGKLEDITVTARRVAENLQDTPVAITAFSGEALERRQILSTDDLDLVTPNLQFSNNAPLAGNNASSQIFIRGIGQTDPTSTVDPGVGLYIDDVYIGTAVGGTLDFRDISSVQVLRGPQGTLFGRNTIGGAIVLTTTEPGEEFGGTARLGVGSDHLRDAFLAADVPIASTLRSRFSFGLRQQDGYVTRIVDGKDLGDTNTYTGTAKFVWKPAEALEAKLLLDYTRSDENGSALVFAAIDESQTFVRVASADAGCPGFNGSFTTLPRVPMIADDRCGNDLQNRGPFSNNGTYPLQSRLRNRGASFHFAYDLSDAVTLKSITSYRDTNWQGIRDADNTPLTILHTAYDSTGDQTSQELQALFKSGALTGVAGLYYFDQSVDDIVTVSLNTPVPGVQLDSDNNDVRNHSWAAFTQWTYSFTEKLGLTLGGRYTEDTKGSIPDQFNFATPDTKDLPLQLYKETFSAFTPSGSVSYRWSDLTMTYVSYSEGFKGGGWNSHFNAPQTAQQLALFHRFGPEEAQTIEAGIKLDLLDRTLRLNGAVFTTDYTDLQFTYRVGVAPYLANAGEASIDGFELEATWIPADAWIFEGSVGHLDARIDSLRNIPGAAIATGVAAGNALPFAPDWQASLGVGYTANLNALRITPRVDASYQSRTFFDANNTTEIAQLDAVTTLNASVGFRPEAGQWRLTLGVNNATDETYPIAGNSSLTTSSGYGEIAYARPREYFASFNYEF